MIIKNTESAKSLLTITSGLANQVSNARQLLTTFENSFKLQALEALLIDAPATTVTICTVTC